MVQETQLFFDEVLKNDLSLTNFVASDFTMLNERLAKHYGIPGVEGEIRKVTLPPDSHRGGLLTMAGVLKVTANGTKPRRWCAAPGCWIASWERRRRRLPPECRPSSRTSAAPPRSASSWPSIARLPRAPSCHAKIDPPGFALENFDVIGGWRENYRSTGNGADVIVDGRRMPYLKGPKVDPTGELADGRRFRNIDELKQILLKDKDQLARALTEKLLTYATGCAPREADKADVEEIVRKVRGKITECGRWCKRSCRAGCFRRSEGFVPVSLL